MSDELIEKLKKAISENENSDDLSKVELEMSNNIEHIYYLQSFYTIPISVFLSIICKVDFSLIMSPLSIIQTIVKNTVRFYKNQSILLLNAIKCKNLDFSLNEYISILRLFISSDICFSICRILAEDEHAVDFDYDFELKQKDEKIEYLKQQLCKKTNPILYEFPPVSEKPPDFEKNIHKAVKLGKLSSVQYLIEMCNANIESRNLQGNTLLHIACLEGHMQIVRYLVEACKCDTNALNKNKDTPLHYACWRGRYPIVKYLIIDQQVDDHPTNLLGQTPLHFACANGNVKTVKFLIEQIGLNKEATTKDGNTPLHYACQTGNLLVAQYLIQEQFVNENAPNKNGETPLHVAVLKRQVKIVKYLLQMKANANISDIHGYKPSEYSTTREIKLIFFKKKAKMAMSIIFIISILILLLYIIYKH